MLFLIINKKQLQHRSELRCMRDQIKTSLITKKVRRIKFGANSPKKTCNLNELWLLISNMNKSSEGISFRGNLYFEGQNWNILEDIWNIKKNIKNVIILVIFLPIPSRFPFLVSSVPSIFIYGAIILHKISPDKLKKRK